MAPLFRSRASLVSSRIRALVAGTLLWSASTSPHARASIVDRVVAVVDTELVLDSDIQLGSELSRRDPSPVPFWRRGPARAGAEQRQVDAAILRAAAGDVALYEPDAEAIRARLEALRATFESRADWTAFLTRWGLDETTMAGVLRRRMVVEAYLQRNLQSDPASDATWNAECTVLLEDLKPRIRVRRVPAPEAGGGR
jgi:hypothetical protein